MKSLLFAVLLFPFAASAQCFGPGGCQDEVYVGPVPPVAEARQLCFPESCAPVRFTWFSKFVIAESALPSGYPVLGWSGPCLTPPCSEIEEQAYQNLWSNARQAHRAARFNLGE
jgi:hypothetical protein